MRTHLPLVLLALLSVAACSSGGSSDLEYTDVETRQDGNFKGDADDYFNNAQNYYGAGDYYRALDQFEKQLKLVPDSRQGLLGTAYCRYNIGRNLAARGRLLDAADQMAKAEETFSRLWNGELVRDTTIDDDFNWKACLGLAMTERAIAALEKQHIDLIDRRLEGIRDASRSAEARKRQKQHEERRAHYLRLCFSKLQRLAQMQNAAPDALLNLGDVQLIRGNESAAERAYLDYLAIARHSVERWRKRREEAHETFKSKNELNRALSAIKVKEESATRKTVNVLVHLAEIKFSRQNYADSLSYLKDAMDLDPNRRELNVPMAECYDRLGNYEQALEHINLYIKSSPSFSRDTQRAFRLRSQLLKKLDRKPGDTTER